MFSFFKRKKPAPDEAHGPDTSPGTKQPEPAEPEDAGHGKDVDTAESGDSGGADSGDSDGGDGDRRGSLPASPESAVAGAVADIEADFEAAATDPLFQEEAGAQPRPQAEPAPKADSAESRPQAEPASKADSAQPAGAGQAATPERLEAAGTDPLFQKEPGAEPRPQAQPAPDAGAAPRATRMGAAAAGVGMTFGGGVAPRAEPTSAPRPEPTPAPAPRPEPVATPEPAPEPAPVPEPTPEAGAAPAAAPAKAGWLARLKKGLARTGQSIGGLFVGVKVDENLFEDLETALIMADAGVEATEKLLTALRARVRKERIEDAAKVKTALREILTDHLSPLEKAFPLGSASPLVVMIAGVNGAGKTTSIGKLANHFQAQGSTVLLAAGDTFRAAAREQLMEWGARNNVTVIAQEGGDPAAVAFDAVNAGRAREAGVVMVDTAGRLPTQLHLMEELKKIKRVIGKADGQAPHEVLLVVDGNTGQNALAQIRAFDAAIGLTGLVVTKLDGTAKGGTLAAVAAGSQGVRPVPVYWIGVGEGLNDLQPFVAREFAGALLGD